MRKIIDKIWGGRQAPGVEPVGVTAEQDNRIHEQENQVADLKDQVADLKDQVADLTQKLLVLEQRVGLLTQNPGAKELAATASAVPEITADPPADALRNAPSEKTGSQGTASERNSMSTSSEETTSQPGYGQDPATSASADEAATTQNAETGAPLESAGGLIPVGIPEEHAQEPSDASDTKPPASEAATPQVGDGTPVLTQEDTAAQTTVREEAIAKALAKDTQRYQEDCKLCGEHRKETDLWLDRANTLRAGIGEAEKICREKAQNGAEILRSLSETIRSVLKGRQEGIELVGNKMLAQAQMLKLGEADKPSELKAPLTEEELRSALGTETDPAKIDALLLAKLDEASAAGYSVVSSWRIFARDAQRAFVSHVANTVIPAIEGLDSGERNATEPVEQIGLQEPASQDALLEWYQTYDQCRRPILEALKAVDIHQMTIPIGQMPDYMRHRAGAVEESDQEAETILSVQREGYEMVLNGQPTLVIREAWVVVSKGRED